MATFKENALRIIAVIGLVAILLLGAWGIIQLAFIIPGFFSGSSNTATNTAAQETLSLSLPAQVPSGGTFTLGWTHKGGTGSYSYAVSYACQDGVSLKAPVPAGSYQTVACNTPFNYTNATSQTPLIATVTGTKAMTLNLSVSASKLSSGTVTASAAARLTVNPATTATATAPAKTTTTSAPTKKASSGSNYVAAPRTASLYGYPDLTVYITSNLSGGVRAGTRVQLQFAVQNTGTNVAQSGWSFTATLPYNPVYTFNSGAQQALYPGDKIVYTLGYDAQYSGQSQYTQSSGCDGWSYPCNQGQPVYGGPGTCNSYGPCNVPGYVPNVYGYYNYGYNQQTASVQVDPYNMIWELNEANNQANVTYTVY